MGRSRNWIYLTRHNRLIQTLAAIFFVAFISAIIVTYVEKYANPQFGNLGEGFWWAIVTMATVGYGDIVPQTTAGRVVATLVMLSGAALFSVFTAAIASSIITNKIREGKGLSNIRYRNHILILGWNLSAEEIIRDIEEYAIRENRSVVLINKGDPEKIEQLIQKFSGLQIKFVLGDYTDETILKRANIAEAFAAIVVPDESDPQKIKSDETTILATLSIKAIEPKVKVIAHVLDPANEGHLRRANADQIVQSNKFSSFLLAHHVASPGIPETLDSLLSRTGGSGLSRRKIPHSMIGKTFADLAQYFKKDHDALLIGFIREEPGFQLDDILSDDPSAIDNFIISQLEAAGKGLARKSKLDIILNPADDFKITDKDAAVVIETSQL